MEEFSDREKLYITLRLTSPSGLDWNAVFTGAEIREFTDNKDIQRHIAEQKIDLAIQKADFQRRSLAKKMIQLEHLEELQPHALKAIYEILSDPDHKDRAMVAKSLLSGQMRYLEKIGENLARNDVPEEVNLGETIDGLDFVDDNESSKD